MAAEAPLFVGLTAVMLLAGAGLAFWCVRTVQAERQRRAFDPQETAALEQAAASLITQLKEAADEAVERVAQASRQLNRLVATAERRMETVWSQEWGQAAPPEPPAEAAHPGTERASVLDTDYVARTAEVYRLADEQLDEAAIAERTGFERAEVRVLLSLRQLGQQPS